MTVALTPAPVLDFFINGQPAVGAKLFTYAGGTTTKINAYTDSTGSAAFTNPIIMNARGEPQNVSGASCGIWLTPGLVYKFVFAPATDTDPPTHPIWTVDNVNGPSTSLVVFDTIALAEAASIPTGIAAILVLGYYAAGDHGGSLYLSASAGAGNGKFQSADGQWWTLQPNVVGYPEQFGAKPNNSGFDNSTAIVNCNSYFPITQLQAANYYTTQSIVLQTNSRLIRGVPVNGDSGGTLPITRIICNSATANIIQVGPNSQPTPDSTVGFLGFINLESITIARSVPVTPVSSGFFGPAGLLVQWVTSCQYTDIWSLESQNAFMIRGTVNCRFESCHGYRSVPGSTSTNDFCCSFMQDNSPNIGFVSGNASLYYTFCGAVGTNTHWNGSTAALTSYGWYSFGGFSDTFMTSSETANTNWGCVFNGSNTSVQSSGEDLSIENSVFDGCDLGGIFVGNSNVANNSVRLQGNYCGPLDSGAGTPAGITFSDIDGSFAVIGNQVISNAASVGSIGLYIFGAAGVAASDNVYIDVSNPIVLNAGNNNIIEGDLITQAYITAAQAVLMTNSGRNVIGIGLRGSVDHATLGVVLVGTGCNYNEIRCSGLDPGIITTANGKLYYNGGAITSAGTFGTTNLAQGIMA
jgi:hypothetical protein